MVTLPETMEAFRIWDKQNSLLSPLPFFPVSSFSLLSPSLRSKPLNTARESGGVQPVSSQAGPGGVWLPNAFW